MARPLADFAVLTFDCYGTLIDWETGIWDALGPLMAGNAAAGRPCPSRRETLAAYAALEPVEEERRPGAPYPEVLASVHHAMADHFGMVTSTALDETFAASVPHWPAFADSAEALRHLKSRFRLVILSNVDRAGIAASIRKLGVEFDAVYTAEDIGSYKPDPGNFAYLLSHLAADFGFERADVLHTAQSLFHDHVPAKAAGLATVWIDRQRLSQGGAWGATAEVANRPEPDYVFFTLGEMAEAVENA
ncbi:MAG TPA: haloacid dehalogenase type II [Acidimicrobiia bacterium]|jgi:2-haloalkanoic acid dehalogenase type II